MTTFDAGLSLLKVDPHERDRMRDVAVGLGITPCAKALPFIRSLPPVPGWSVSAAVGTLYGLTITPLKEWVWSLADNQQKPRPAVPRPIRAHEIHET